MIKLSSHTRRLVAAGLVAASAITFAAPAQAGVIGSSILEILNFQIKNANTGAQLTLTGPGASGDITIIAGNNTADVSAELNGITSTLASPLASVTVGPGFGAIDLVQQCVGTGCPPFAENSFSGVGQNVPPTTNYSLADMVLTGSALDASALGGPSGGVNAKTRADVSIAGGTNDGSSTSNTGADVALQLTSASDILVMFSFDYILEMLAYVDTSDPGTTGSTQAATSWSLSLFQLSNPNNKLTFNPSEINQTINLSVDANVPVVDSGSLASGSFLLVGGQNYQFGVSHSTRADATFAVPEPGVIGIFGLATLLLGVAMKRRNAA